MTTISSENISKENTGRYGSVSKCHAASLQNGFTLVEVLMAMVILLIGMLGVIAMQYHAVSGNAASRELRVAVNIAQQLLEQMKSTPYAQLTSSSDTPAPDTAATGGVGFTRRWWVQSNCHSLTLTGDNGTCTALGSTCAGNPGGTVPASSSAIRIRTCWLDKNAINHSVTLDTVRWDERVIP